MRSDELLHARMHASQVRAYAEYPKYIDVAGKSELALNAEHEAELLGLSPVEQETGAGEESAPGQPENLLSAAPEKRKPGRPPGAKNKPVLVHSNSEG